MSFGWHRNEHPIWDGHSLWSAVSYGCVTWGHEFTYQGKFDTFSFTRYFNNLQWMGEQQGATQPGSWVATGIPAAVSPKAPSDDFQKTVPGYFANVKAGCPNVFAMANP